MRFVEEFRSEAEVRRLALAIARLVTRPWSVMEVCGGQTHSIVKHGLTELLPEGVELVHGPGCPVCVTPVDKVDAALDLARRSEVILCTFGDMQRVPGTTGDLARAKAEGADVRIVYSPLDAVELAAAVPTREVVFFAVGFETTAPATALAVLHAARRRVDNFSLLVAHVLVPPALNALLADDGRRVQAFLAAGHVCAVAGYAAYEAIVARHRVPIVVTGFEPVDIMAGVYRCLRQLEEGRAEVENQYERCARLNGNPEARAAVDAVFQVSDAAWRGLGELPESGLRLRPGLARFDAERRFGAPYGRDELASGCLAGKVLTGALKPTACPHFGGRCRPETPLGAPMVSSEGACAAYYQYRRRKES